MSASTPPLPADRLAVGQLLVRLLHRFRSELFADPALEQRYRGIRFPHLQVWGNVGIDGIRLTALADRANLGLAATSELVNELQDLGYLERRGDPTDRRAKLIFPTQLGRELLDDAGRAVAELEERWRARCPAGTFDEACRTLDGLVRSFEEGRVAQPAAAEGAPGSDPTGGIPRSSKVTRTT